MGKGLLDIRRLAEKRSRDSQRRVPGSQLKILRGSGHFPMFESPYEFNEIVRAFLKEHGIN